MSNFLTRLRNDPKQAAIALVVGAVVLVALVKRKNTAAADSSTTPAPTYTTVPGVASADGAIGVGTLAGYVSDLSTGQAAITAALQQLLEQGHNTPPPTDVAGHTTVRDVGGGRGETASQVASRLNASGEKCTNIGGPGWEGRPLTAGYILFANNLGSSAGNDTPLGVGYPLIY